MTETIRRIIEVASMLDAKNHYDLADKMDRCILASEERGWLQSAIDEFGTTTSPLQGGFLLPDGTYLDLGREYFMQPGPRSPNLREHPEVGYVIPLDDRHGGKNPDYIDQERFSKQTGAFRWIYPKETNTEGIRWVVVDIAKMPTRAQWGQLKQVVYEPETNVAAYIPRSGEKFELRGQSDLVELSRHIKDVFDE